MEGVWFSQDRSVIGRINARSSCYAENRAARLLGQTDKRLRRMRLNKIDVPSQNLLNAKSCSVVLAVKDNHCVDAWCPDRRCVTIIDVHRLLGRWALVRAIVI